MIVMILILILILMIMLFQSDENIQIFLRRGGIQSTASCYILLYHNDLKYDLFSWVLRVQKILIVNRDGDRDLTQ